MLSLLPSIKCVFFPCLLLLFICSTFLSPLTFVLFHCLQPFSTFISFPVFYQSIFTLRLILPFLTCLLSLFIHSAFLSFIPHPLSSYSPLSHSTSSLTSGSLHLFRVPPSRLHASFPILPSTSHCLPPSHTFLST